MPFRRPLTDGETRRPNDQRRIRYADDFANPIGITTIRPDLCPTIAATIEAKMSGRVIEIFRPAKRKRSEVERIPAEYLERVGEIRTRDLPPVDPAQPIDFESLL